MTTGFHKPPPPPQATTTTTTATATKDMVHPPSSRAYLGRTPHASESSHRRTPSGSGPTMPSRPASFSTGSLSVQQSQQSQQQESHAHASIKRMGSRLTSTQFQEPPPHASPLTQTQRASKSASQQGSHSIHSRYRGHASKPPLGYANGRSSSERHYASRLVGESAGEEESSNEADAHYSSGEVTDTELDRDTCNSALKNRRGVNEAREYDVDEEEAEDDDSDDAEMVVWDCPLCMEEVDGQDVDFNPCECGYQICRFCWHHIKSVLNDKCPACRRSYTEQEEEMVTVPAMAQKARKARSTTKKSKASNAASGNGSLSSHSAGNNGSGSGSNSNISSNNSNSSNSSGSGSGGGGHQAMVPVTTTTRGGAPLGHVLPSRKHLVELRVLQQNLVYVIGIPLHADCYPELVTHPASSAALVTALENVLVTSKYFGRYGHIVKLVINLKGQHASLPVLSNAKHARAPALAPASSATTTTVSAFLTFERREDAKDAIETIDGTLIGGFPLRATYGTTKYCAFFLRGQNCPNHAHCLYLHEVGEEHNSYTKEALSARQRDNQLRKSAGPSGEPTLSAPAKTSLGPKSTSHPTASSQAAPVSPPVVVSSPVEPAAALAESPSLSMTAILPPVFSPTVFHSPSATGSTGKPPASPAVVGFSGSASKSSSSGSLLVFDPMNPSNDIRYSESHASYLEPSLNLAETVNATAPASGRATSRFLFAELKPSDVKASAASDTLNISNILATRSTPKVDDGLEYFRSVFPNIRVSLDQGAFSEQAAAASTGFEKSADAAAMLPPPGLNNSAQAFLDQFIRPDSPVATTAALTSPTPLSPVPQTPVKSTPLSPDSRPFSPGTHVRPLSATGPALTRSTASMPMPAPTSTSAPAPVAPQQRIVPGYALKTKKPVVAASPAPHPTPSSSPPPRQPTPPTHAANEIVVVSKKNSTPKKPLTVAPTKSGSGAAHATSNATGLVQAPSNTFSLLLEESEKAERHELSRAESTTATATATTTTTVSASQPSSSLSALSPLQATGAQHKKTKSNSTNAPATPSKSKKSTGSTLPLSPDKRSAMSSSSSSSSAVAAVGATDKPAIGFPDPETTHRLAERVALVCRSNGNAKWMDGANEPDSDDLEPFQYVNEVDFDDLVEIFPCFPSILEHEVSKMSLIETLPSPAFAKKAIKSPCLAPAHRVNDTEESARVGERDMGSNSSFGKGTVRDETEAAAEDESFDALEKELARAREEAKRLETKLMAVMQRNRTFVFIE